MINPAVLPGRGPITYLWTDEYVKEIVSDAIRSARSSGLWDVRGETSRATFAADAVVNCADEWQVDYIIVGASHRSALMQVFSGSVSREIALKASCPVLIAAQTRVDIENTKRAKLDRLVCSLSSKFWCTILRNIRSIGNKSANTSRYECIEGDRIEAFS
jgi:hypothetical protein